MKKILLIYVALFTTLSMNAQVEKLIYEMDWAGVEYTEWNYFGEAPNASYYKATDEGLAITNPAINDHIWEVRVINRSSEDHGLSLEEGHDYVVRLTLKVPSDGQIFMQLGDLASSWYDGTSVSASDDWQVIDIESPSFYYDISDGAHVLLGFGEMVGTTILKKVQVYEVHGSSTQDDYNKEVVSIDKTTFPDEDFRNWVLSQEYGKDGVLTEEEIAGVTFMNLFPQNLIAEGHIKSLKGIEYFTAMTRLVCSRNELTVLDLSKNTELTRLECDQNHLTELDLSKNTELTYLDCNSNELTALDVSCCNKLTELNCFGNKLTTLNVSGCNALTNLKCYSNQLAVIDLSGCTSLATMWAFDNQLSALNVLDCISLSTLWCEDNKLPQLDMSKNTKLTDLRCSGNQLTQLDVSNNTELKELRCNDNQLTALDLSENKMLTSLRTYHNPIKGEAMDALIESLPTASRGGWCCVLSEDEVGVVTTSQVAAAKLKGWTSYYWNEAAKNWMEYVGSETAQDDYRPLVEEGKVWKVGSCDSGNPVQMVEYYYFDGDTIIGGKTCKQMMCQRYISPDYPEYDLYSQLRSLSYVGAWYEENKKVYEYDTTDKQFKLMYDFSVEANDTIEINNRLYVIGPKQTGGKEGFKGVYRNVRLWEDGVSYYSVPWLEGVGGTDRPTNNVYPGVVDPMWFLMECYVGDEVIYLNGAEDGATPAEARKQRIDFTHTTKVNPKTRSEEEQSLYGEYNEQLLSINLDPINDAYMVSITDESGKTVYEKAINAGSIVGLNIDISKYAKGHYTVTVENSNESFIGEFNAQTTGIEEVKSKKSEIRGYIYNLQGQRLSSLQKGLNIVNRQKVYVK